MKVLILRPTWGIDVAAWPALFRKAKDHGYAGVELNLHRAGSRESQVGLKKLLDELGLVVVVQTFSSWTNYAGPRPPSLSIDNHINEYRLNLEAAKVFDPILINVQSGCDYWSEDTSVDFYHQTLLVDAQLGLKGKVAHETHRNRSFFHPFFTDRILQRVPEIRLTGDLSHWICVCERLLDVSSEDVEVMDRLLPKVYHIHARIGTTQSTQCPDPTDAGYARERRYFEDTWKKIIKLTHDRAERDWITVVPEYGAYPYMPLHHPTPFVELGFREGDRLQELLNTYAASLN